MVWQETPLPPGMRLDAEQERELRLISQARAGADWALAALVARYQPMVVRYLTRLVGDAERARDLAEEVFLRMERRLRGPHGGEYLRLWLLRACTETGLDALRRPRRGASSPRLDVAGSPARLLSERVGSSAQRLRTGFGKLAERTSATSRQMRHLIWANDLPEATSPPDTAFGAAAPVTSAPPPEETLDPRAALRHQMVRAVLAEIPYGDAQCVALHLVAGLNQAEVAQALGIRASAARRHIVLGLDVFSQRYESALAQLGIPPELAYADLESVAPIPAPHVEIPVPDPAPPTIEATVVTIPNLPTSEADARDHAPEAAPTDDEPAPVAATAYDAEVAETETRAEPIVAAATEAAEAEEAIAAEAAEAEEAIASGEAADEPPAKPAADAPLPPVIVPVRGEDVRVHTGSEAVASPEDAPPFLVEPPLWQSPELADGALSPSASLSRQKPSTVTLVVDSPTVQSKPAREETLAAVAGTLLAPLAPLPAPGLEAEPPRSPIIEAAAIVAPPDPIAQDASAYTRAELAPLAYEPVADPRRPSRAMPQVVPVLSSAPTAEASTPASIPPLSTGQASYQMTGQAAGQARVHAEIKDAAPDPTAPTTGMTPTVPKPAVVPVRTPDD